MHGIREISNFVQDPLFHQSVISDKSAQTGSNQFKQVSSFIIAKPIEVSYF